MPAAKSARHCWQNGAQRKHGDLPSCLHELRALNCIYQHKGKNIMPAAKATPVPFTGNVDEFNDRMERYHAANLRLRQNKAALTTQYPNQWVAVDENGLITVAPTSEELANRLREMGRLGDAVATGFMTTKPKLTIL